MLSKESCVSAARGPLGRYSFINARNKLLRAPM